MSTQTQEPRRIPGMPRPYKHPPPPTLATGDRGRVSAEAGDAVEVLGEDGRLPGEWRVLSVGETEISVGSGPTCFLRFNIRTGLRVTGGRAGWIRPVNPAGGK